MESECLESWCLEPARGTLKKRQKEKNRRRARHNVVIGGKYLDEQVQLGSMQLEADGTLAKTGPQAKLTHEHGTRTWTVKVIERPGLSYSTALSSRRIWKKMVLFAESPHVAVLLWK